MAYRSTEKTRQKKDAKRTGILQAAVQVFAKKGYHAATVRDVVELAGVAIGTFYFYFPDKETMFVYLYEETADLLVRTVQQAVNRHDKFTHQIATGLQAYINIAIYEPAIIHLLLVGGVGAVPALTQKYNEFRDRMVQIWQRALVQAMEDGHIPTQNSYRIATAFAGAFDQVILDLLKEDVPEDEVDQLVREMTQFAMRSVSYR